MGKKCGTPPNLFPIVSISTPNIINIATNKVEPTTLIRYAGYLGFFHLTTKMATNAKIETNTETNVNLLRLVKYTFHFCKKSVGTESIFKPNKSLIWVEINSKPIPAVKPITTGYGIYLIYVPNLSNPAKIKIRPAKTITTTKPS